MVLTTKGKITIVLIVLAIIAVIGAIVYFMSGNQTPNADQDATAAVITLIQNYANLM